MMTDPELMLYQLLLHLADHYPDVRIEPRYSDALLQAEAVLRPHAIPGYTMLDVLPDPAAWRSMSELMMHCNNTGHEDSRN